MLYSHKRVQMGQYLETGYWRFIHFYVHNEPWSKTLNRRNGPKILYSLQQVIKEKNNLFKASMYLHTDAYPIQLYCTQIYGEVSNFLCLNNE